MLLHIDRTLQELYISLVSICVWLSTAVKDGNLYIFKMYIPVRLHCEGVHQCILHQE